MKKHTPIAPALYLTLFLTGAAVLVVEVTATRLLSPHFGMTLFTVSSIITAVLAALSLGYWLGGRLADRSPTFSTLYTVILCAGMTVLIIHLLNTKLLPAWFLTFDLITGPIVASLILFFIPMLCLGMVSPIAIRLSVTKIDSVGEIAGKIFFLSTAGSIVGSLAAGFLLIPRLPVSQIIIGTSLVLVVIGLLGIYRRIKTQTWIMLLATTAAFFLMVQRLRTQTDRTILHEDDSMYQHIRVAKYDFPEGEGRVLRLDRTWAGAGYIDSSELPFPYTRYYKLYELINGNASRFLFLGGGAYTTPLKLLDERTDEIVVDVVEIDPELPEIAETYFNLNDDPRLTIIIDDARSYLARTEKRYDVIFIDVYSQDIGIPAHLMSIEFIRLVQEHLTERGTVIMNVATNLDAKAPSHGLSAIRTFRTIFPTSEFIAMNPDNLTELQNIMFWGIKDQTWVFDPNHPKILHATSDELGSLSRHRIDFTTVNLNHHPIFTDDYAPVEYLVAKMIQASLR